MKWSNTYRCEIPDDYIPEEECNEKWEIEFDLDCYQDFGDYETPPDSGWEIKDVRYVKNGEFIAKPSWMNDEIEEEIIAQTSDIELMGEPEYGNPDEYDDD